MQEDSLSDRSSPPDDGDGDGDGDDDDDDDDDPGELTVTQR